MEVCSFPNQTKLFVQGITFSPATGEFFDPKSIMVRTFLRKFALNVFLCLFLKCSLSHPRLLIPSLCVFEFSSPKKDETSPPPETLKK
jgi:hypothetical protein